MNFSGNLHGLMAAVAMTLGIGVARRAPTQTPAREPSGQRRADPARAARRRLVARHGRRQALKLIKRARREGLSALA
jgi:hypothetical protein